MAKTLSYREMLRANPAPSARLPWHPSPVVLAESNIMTDLPVEQHSFAVYRQRGALLGAMNAAFKIGQPITVAIWMV